MHIFRSDPSSPLSIAAPFRRPPTYRIALRFPLPPQALLVEAVLDHRVRLQQRLAVKERLDAERAKVNDEIQRGLRVEFHVQPELMGLVVGVKVWARGA